MTAIGGSRPQEVASHRLSEILTWQRAQVRMAVLAPRTGSGYWLAAHDPFWT
jgi:hypothetical protein